MTNPVFICPVVLLGEVSVALSQASPGQLVYFAGTEAAHASKSMRLKAGESLDLVDGRGSRCVGVVKEASGSGLGIQVLRVETEPRSKPALVLVQALAKSGRAEQAIEMAIELGADEIIPWQADRSIVRWEAKKAEQNRLKWQRLSEAATKQSRRSWVPQVQEVVSTKALSTVIGELVETGGIVLVLHESAELTLGELCREECSKLLNTPVIAVVVGPEGGITDSELEDFSKQGAQVIRVGKHVMRSSSAGPATLAALNTQLGRW